MHSPVEKIAIILVNWHGFSHTQKCVLSLQKVYATKLEIIVVDNGSGRDELRCLQTLANITLIENEVNLGFTGGNNVGIAYAIKNGSDVIVLLNNDTEVEPDFLLPLVEQLKRKETGAVQPKIMTMQRENTLWNVGGRFNSWLGLPRVIGEGVHDTGQYDQVRAIDWVTGCCLAARVDVFKEVGLLDKTYFLLCEDVDWSLRVKKAGYQLMYEPKSKIHHFEGSTSRLKNSKEALSPFRLYFNVRNHLFLIKRYTNRLTRPFAMILYFTKVLGWSAYFLIRGRKEKLRYTILGIRDGVFNLGPIKVPKQEHSND